MYNIHKRKVIACLFFVAVHVTAPLEHPQTRLMVIKHIILTDPTYICTCIYAFLKHKTLPYFSCFDKM